MTIHPVNARTQRTNWTKLTLYTLWTELNWAASSFAFYSPCNATELNWHFSSAQFCRLTILKSWSRVSSLRKPTSKLRSVACHIGSHNVTHHPTQVNVPHLNPSRADWYLIYLPQRDRRLSCRLYSDMVYLPIDNHPFKKNLATMPETILPSLRSSNWAWRKAYTQPPLNLSVIKLLLQQQLLQGSPGIPAKTLTHLWMVL